jgi:hypothetical protein|tara:strand:+ start:8944 stop:9246 length:303 start_codon:yes stop_codon:yes gene_type:complete
MENLETIQLKKEQRQNKINLVSKYKSKLNFSIISLIFFLLITLYTFFVPLLGIIPPIVFGLISLVFIQQTILSYNYLKFHTNNYWFMESVYKSVEDIKSK